jgi:outer membrane lipoprotein-sorting protein
MSRTNNPRDHAPELEPQLEAAVWSVLSEPLDAEAIARVEARAAAIRAERSPESAILPPGVSSSPITSSVHELDQTYSTQSPVPFLSRSLMMKCLSTVAGIVIVVGATFLLQSTPSAFGEVIKQLRAARSYTYVTRLYTEGNAKPIETKVMVAEDGRQRHEFAGETVSIMDSSSRIRLTLIQGSKTALVYEAGQPQTGGPKNDQLAWLENLKAHGDKPDEQLGKKMLDGRSVEGFVAKQGQYAYTVWIDTKTKELVQVEHGMFVKGSSITKVVMTDFRFNEALDESLFSFEVPKGYETRKQRPVPNVAGGEKSIVEALRGYTKRSAGKFPKSISEWGEWAVLFSTGSKDGQPSEETTEIMTHLGSILPFLVARSKDDYQYLGAGKSLDDKRCIVFWYRNKDATLRAIYNDLSVADVQEKDLP